MSKLQDIYQKLFDVESGMRYPNLVYNNEIKKRNIGVGDYRPTWDSKLQDEFFRFEFPNIVKWDFDLAKKLKSTVSEYERFEIPRFNPDFAEIVTKNTKIPKYMIHDNFMIFDKLGYKNGLHDIMESLSDYEPYSYVDPYSEDHAKTRGDVMEWLPYRICAFIDEKAITANLSFIEIGSELIENIGSKFFGAKI